MKIKEGFVLHSVGDENVVVAIGKMTKKFRGMIRLNSTGAFIFRQLEKENPGFKTRLFTAIEGGKVGGFGVFPE